MEVIGLRNSRKPFCTLRARHTNAALPQRHLCQPRVPLNFNPTALKNEPSEPGPPPASPRHRLPLAGMGFSNPQPRPPPPSQNKQPPNPLISTYTHLSNLPHADEALRILHQLASRVVPIMRKHKWRVGTLAEFLPDYDVLQGHTSFTTNPFLHEIRSRS